MALLYPRVSILCGLVNALLSVPVYAGSIPAIDALSTRIVAIKTISIRMNEDSVTTNLVTGDVTGSRTSYIGQADRETGNGFTFSVERAGQNGAAVISLFEGTSFTLRVFRLRNDKWTELPGFPAPEGESAIQQCLAQIQRDNLPDRKAGQPFEAEVVVDGDKLVGDFLSVVGTDSSATVGLKEPSVLSFSSANDQYAVFEEVDEFTRMAGLGLFPRQMTRRTAAGGSAKTLTKVTYQKLEINKGLNPVPAGLRGPIETLETNLLKR
ncbi:MAG: hypothetical protein K1X53_10375 [Candidatus Sumerlaeaceae bacterium]|nr:hypothetical protein [Candidatus Sumerlaeaceae bacterium]